MPRATRTQQLPNELSQNRARSILPPRRFSSLTAFLTHFQPATSFQVRWAPHLRCLQLLKGAQSLSARGGARDRAVAHQTVRCSRELERRRAQGLPDVRCEQGPLDFGRGAKKHARHAQGLLTAVSRGVQPWSGRGSWWVRKSI